MATSALVRPIPPVSWGYGQPKPTPEQVEDIKKKVYDNYPLPPFDEEGNSTKKVTSQVATGVGIATVGYVLYKGVVALATWECFGCGVLVTP